MQWTNNVALGLENNCKKSICFLQITEATKNSLFVSPIVNSGGKMKETGVDITC